MTRSIRFHEPGGPEVMHLEDVALPAPAEDEVQVRSTAIGVNFIDVYERTGLYPVPLPSGLGKEAAGVVVGKGRKVKGIRLGQRVAYVLGTRGAYAEAVNVPADRVVPLPTGVTDEQAAAMILKGLTAEFLLRRAHRLKKGEVVLAHAAAGGVGLILAQWARALGATVIGVVGSEEKAALARKHGCRHVIVSGRDELVPSVKRITKGAGVDVVYDSVGKDTFMGSLDCLRPRGLMVSYGNASGPPPALSPLELSRRGSLFLTRPTLNDYTRSPEQLRTAARALFSAVQRGILRIRVGQSYPLAEVREAHRALEGRRTVGSTVLRP